MLISVTMSSMPQQIPLRLRLDDDATFENWVARESLSTASDYLSAAVVPADGAFIWGGRGVGKSHCLQAVCHANAAALFFPGKEIAHYCPEDVIAGLDEIPLVVIDDIHALLPSRDWQLALFNWFNRVRSAGGNWVVSSQPAPGSFVDVLPDLVSRLKSLPIFHFSGFSDAELGVLLTRRAEGRGLMLSTDVIHFILHRVSRDPHQLMALLDRLDELSLRERRVITIPLLSRSGVLDTPGLVSAD
jgi:DnaA family protein